MGVGIAYVFAVAGWSTYVVEPNDAQAITMRKTIAETAAQGAKRGKLLPDLAAALPDSIIRLADIAALPETLGLVVETVPERLALKLEVLRQIELRQPHLIASNTSALSIDELSVALQGPSLFFGMHFFNPVWSLPLIEIVRGTKTDEHSIVEAKRIAQLVGKESIVVTDTPGFATSRLDLIASLEAMRMVEAGVATAADIDLAMVTAYRHPIGPLRLTDIVGLDVRLDIARALTVSLGERYEPPQILIELVANGHLGRKSGQGFYNWNES
jgi:3-hydroxybutyryl-CoA dehydrogenase